MTRFNSLKQGRGLHMLAAPLFILSLSACSFYSYDAPQPAKARPVAASAGTNLADCRAACERNFQSCGDEAPAQRELLDSSVLQGAQADCAASLTSCFNNCKTAR